MRGDISIVDFEMYPMVATAIAGAVVVDTNHYRFEGLLEQSLIHEGITIRVG
jgi:hypothetical protein